MPRNGSVHVKSYKRVVKGKVQDVEQYTSIRSLADIIAKAGDRPPVSAKGGEFPRGRSVPGHFPSPTSAAKVASAHADELKRKLETQRKKDSKTTAEAAKKAKPVAEAAGYEVTPPDSPDVAKAKQILEKAGHTVKKPKADVSKAAKGKSDGAGVAGGGVPKAAGGDVGRRDPGVGGEGARSDGGGSQLDPEVAAKAIRLVGENGGLSINMVDGSEPPDGYMVARDSDQFGTAVSASEFYGPRGAQILADFLIRNKADLGEGKAYLGVWHQKERTDADGNTTPLSEADQVVHLDVTDRVVGRDEAVQLGQDRNQISVWDVANFEEIQTGGSGTARSLLLDEQLPQEQFDLGGGKANIKVIADFLKTRIKRGGGSKDGDGSAGNPIDVGDDVELAHQLLSEGKHIRMKSVAGVNTLVGRVRDVVAKAKADGNIDALPEYDLCKVSVPKTNLFCAKSKGIPRIKMPQFGGEPTPGTVADARRIHPDGWTNDKGEKERVDIEPDFRELLREMGIKVTPKTVKTASLKASQEQLDLSKVADLSQAMLDGKITEAPIFVTKDGYIIDGHHRWASKMVNTLAGDENSSTMPVEMLDIEIGEALALSTQFAEMMGIAPQDVERRSLSPQSRHQRARSEAVAKTEERKRESKQVLAEAERQIANLPKPEPTNKELRAEYAERAKKVAPKVMKKAKDAERDITALLVRTAADNGGEMTGLEFRLKERESMERKLVDKAVDKGITPEEYGERIADALRYTALFHPDEYVSGAEAMLQALRDRGFTVVSVENSWERGDGYSGTNVELIHPNGLRWELQFHTHDSVEMKEVAHKYYELTRKAEIAMEIRKELYARMVQLWEYVDQPEGWQDFGTLIFRDDAPKEAVSLAAKALFDLIERVRA